MSDCIEMAQVARNRARRKLFQPAVLDAGGEPRRVHLLDLSETGAQLDAAVPPPEASFVSLICGDVKRAARVAWVRGRRCGIQFVMPLSAAELDEVLAAGARR